MTDHPRTPYGIGYRHAGVVHPIRDCQWRTDWASACSDLAAVNLTLLYADHPEADAGSFFVMQRETAGGDDG